MNGQATYHVLRDDDSGTVLAMFRLRDEPGEPPAFHLEAYRPGEGWVTDHRAADVFRNGQDYDLLDEAAAEELIARMEAGEA
jgi:hypothetical protein